MASEKRTKAEERESEQDRFENAFETWIDDEDGAELEPDFLEGDPGGLLYLKIPLWFWAQIKAHPDWFFVLMDAVITENEEASEDNDADGEE